MSISANNRRIAKNTLALYVRMGVTLLVSLFTSRVILQTLGVEDFGIYNVVGGVVVLFSFLNSAMSSATQRFLNFELGRKNFEQVARVFSMSMSVHFCIAGAVFILAETLGLWFLNSQLNIPAERMVAANWVYQFSVASTLLGIMLVPYNATIIAFERMTFFALASIMTTLLRLGIVFLLCLGNADKLILYAALIFAVGVVMQIVNIVYCRRAFQQTAIYRPFRDKKLFTELISFSSWSLLGSAGNVAMTQGTSIAINLFCGVAVNAAMGVASQVNAAVYQFVSNFQTAVSPQIVKNFSSGARSELMALIFRSSKFSFFLLLILAVPVFFNADFLLNLWLADVPAHAVNFVKIILFNSLIGAINGPLWFSIWATGKIRLHEILNFSRSLLNFPLACFALSAGCPPEAAVAVIIFLELVLTCSRLLILRKEIALSLRKYFQKTCVPAILATAISVPAPWFVAHLFENDHGWLALFSICVAWVVVFAPVGFFVGLDKHERASLLECAKKILARVRQRHRTASEDT